jgi:anti-sigma factor RsiW
VSCPSFESLSAYADGEAAPQESAATAAHLHGCPRCGLTLRGIRARKAAVAALPVPPMPRDLRRDLLGLARRAEPRRPAGWAWLRPALGFALAAALALLGGDGPRL